MASLGLSTGTEPQPSRGTTGGIRPRSGPAEDPLAPLITVAGLIEETSTALMPSRAWFVLGGNIFLRCATVVQLNKKARLQNKSSAQFQRR